IRATGPSSRFAPFPSGHPCAATHAGPAGARSPGGGPMADHVQHDPNAPVRPTDGATVTRGAERDAVAAQHARYGGVKWGAALFGWLNANGFAVILLALLSAAGVALGLANNVDTADEAANQAQTIGIGGGI